MFQTFALNLQVYIMPSFESNSGLLDQENDTGENATMKTMGVRSFPVRFRGFATTGRDMT